MHGQLQLGPADQAGGQFLQLLALGRRYFRPPRVECHGAGIAAFAAADQGCQRIKGRHGHILDHSRHGIPDHGAIGKLRIIQSAFDWHRRLYFSLAVGQQGNRQIKR